MVSALIAIVLTKSSSQPILRQEPERPEFKRVRIAGLTELGAYRMLNDLTTNVGGRVSGSPEAAKAVVWTTKQMKAMGLQNVHLVPCMVPHWVRGKTEKAIIIGQSKPLAVCALGGSVGTPKKGLEAEVIEVKSLQEVASLGAKCKGKIVFYNRPFDATLTKTFSAYGGAVDQRVAGPSMAAKYGAVAVVVRSMTLAKDDAPHTGALVYSPGKKIPGAALGIQSADRLTQALRKGRVRLRLILSCKNLPDVPSASVAGEIVGSELPNEIIVMGGHLDSWDLGRGAHDDGAGITQSLEAVRLLKKLGLRPKRTIRVVAFMNEENGTRGAKAYGAMAAKSSQKHYAAIESDSGGFMPRGFGVSKAKLETVKAWEPLFRPFGIERFTEGGGDADIAPLAPLGTTLFALEPENQRYFDYHHSRNDVIANVNARELEFGAISMALLAWLISEEGL